MSIDGCIGDRFTGITAMTDSGIQASHEHFSIYDSPAVYSHTLPDYEPPDRQQWFDVPIARTPQPVMHEPVIEPEPEPEMVSYEPQPPDSELIDILMQQTISRLHAGSYEPLDPIMDRFLTESIKNRNSAHLEDGLKQIEQEISLVQNNHLEPHQMTSEQPMEMMDQFQSLPSIVREK
jgi:hypothetical protein